MAPRPDDKFLPLKNPGIKGWNTFDDPASIDDAELADVQNMDYDNGFISPREGSELTYEKPEGETGQPLQLIKAQTSDGIKYMVAVYANHFYVRHPTNDEWIRINHAYIPTQIDLYYGSTNWNNGRGDDRLYGCNGVDDFFRWDICVGTVSGATLAGATTITLVDGSRFPTGAGTLVLIDSLGNTITQDYSSRSGNIFTLTGVLPSNVDDGASTAAEMQQKSDMEIGKYVSKNQRRLIIANYYGGETVVWGSKQGDPEFFTPGADIEDAFTQTIADGNGEITGLHDFGQFLIAEKEDSIHSIQIQISDDLGSKLLVVDPLVAGESIGPLAMQSTARVQNKLYYPTQSNGFMAITPATSGTSVSVNTEFLSQKIDPFLQNDIDLSLARTAASSNKVYWAVALVGASQNILTLEYDILRSAWTKHFGWAVKDLVEIDNEIFFLDFSDGTVRKINNGQYNDAGNEYLASASFKRFDYGEVGRPKTQDVIYVQGYMTPASEFFFDVFFNEDGVLGKQTYRINKDTVGLSFSAPITDEMGAFVLGLPILGMAALKGIANVRVFRCYLGTNIFKGFYNIQPRVYGTRAAFWGITAMAMNPEVLPITPQDFIVAPESSV